MLGLGSRTSGSGSGSDSGSGFGFSLFGGLIRNIGTHGEIREHCMLLLPKYLDYICNF